MDRCLQSASFVMGAMVEDVLFDVACLLIFLVLRWAKWLLYLHTLHKPEEA